MARIPLVESLKWNTTSPFMASLMTWPNFITISSIWTMNFFNGPKSFQGYVSWTKFLAKLYDHFDTNTHSLGHLTKLTQSGTMEVFIVSFEKLAFRTNHMSNTFSKNELPMASSMTSKTKSS
jgi:hypothetical protein